MVAEAVSSPSSPSTTGRAKAPDWARAYAWRLAVSDLVALVLATFAAQWLRFGIEGDQSITLSARLGLVVGYVLISLVLIVAWMIVLAVFRTRDPRVVGVGALEYRRVVQSALYLFGIGAIILVLTKTDVSRGYVLIALLLGVVLLMLDRWLWRQWLRARRGAGDGFSYRLLVVGSKSSVSAVVRDLSGRTGLIAGYRVVAAVVPGWSDEAKTLDGTSIPVTGDPDAILTRMAESGADTLVIGSSDRLSPRRIRELSWQLEPGRQHLVMVPNLTDVGGPRIHTRPVAGLPLLHVETPTFQGAQLFVKRTFDVVGSGLLLIVLSPVFAVFAAIVRLTSPGPVFFHQERVGIQGRSFRMHKFRSMVVDAESRLAGLLGQRRDAGNDVMFKLRDDPRVTPIGRLMRRYSIDELPQLWNVLAGGDVARRPAAAAAARGRAVRGACESQVPREARHHRTLAGLGPLVALVGGDRAPRPLLRRELVGRRRPRHPLADGARGLRAGRGRTSRSGMKFVPPAVGAAPERGYALPL